jgi:hypothetical protein
MKLLTAVGFTTVLECHCPLEPSKSADRATFLALKGAPAILHSYPWINGKTEQEIKDTLRPCTVAVRSRIARAATQARDRVRSLVAGLMPSFDKDRPSA